MTATNLQRIVEAIPDDRVHAMRAALDCFAPLALTIRVRPRAPDPSGQRARAS